MYSCTGCICLTLFSGVFSNVLSICLLKKFHSFGRIYLTPLMLAFFILCMISTCSSFIPKAWFLKIAQFVLLCLMVAFNLGKFKILLLLDQDDKKWKWKGQMTRLFNVPVRGFENALVYQTGIEITYLALVRCPFGRCLPGAMLVRRRFCLNKTVFWPTNTDEIVG